MNERQFALQQEMLEMILNKLEEIRCCIIDMEDAIEKSSHQADPADHIKICPLIGCPCERADEQVGDLQCDNCGDSARSHSTFLY